VPISAQASALLEGLTRYAGSDLVFTFDGEHATVDGHAKDRLDAELEESLPHFTLHDFRRSGATYLQRQKMDHAVTDILLAHRPFGKVKGTYHVYAYEEERRVALELWGAFLAGAEGEVVALNPSAQKSLASEPSDGEIHATPASEGLFTAPNPAIRRSQLITRERMRANLILEILTDHEADSAKTEIYRRKDAAPWLKAVYPNDPLRAAVQILIEVMVAFVVLAAPMFKLSEVKKLLLTFGEARDHARVLAQQLRQDAAAIRRQAESLGRPEMEALASKREREAEKAEADAKVAQSLIEVFTEQDPISKTPIVVRRSLKSGSRFQRATEASGAHEVMLRATAKLFTRPAATIAAKLAHVLGEVSRNQNRLERMITIVSPDPLPLVDMRAS
jgi:hypothetical protein